jgi:hypothetical protein
MYDVDYFIKKFKAIPQNLWISGGLFTYRHRPESCALGHCGLKEVGYYPTELSEVPEEAQALIKICGGELSVMYSGHNMGPDYDAVWKINDTRGNPKENMVNFLENIKAIQEASMIEAEAVN